jgi:hypothetical protein
MNQWRKCGSVLLIVATLGISSTLLAQDPFEATGVIAFERDGQIFLINFDGTEERFVADGGQPDLSSSGNKIAYIREFEAYLNTLDGSSEQQVTFSPGQFAFAPSFAPDDSSLAIWEPVAGTPAGKFQEQNLVRIDLTLLFAEKITVDAELQDDPDWAPDGKRLVYARRGFGQNGDEYELFTIAVDGTEKIRLTDDDLIQAQPAWSPDGSLIAYTDLDDLFVMSADGSNIRQITDTEFSFERRPTWSPSGTHLAFEWLDFNNIWQIHVINLDGTGEQVLVSSDTSATHPSWGP